MSNFTSEIPSTVALLFIPRMMVLVGCKGLRLDSGIWSHRVLFIREQVAPESSSPAIFNVPARISRVKPGVWTVLPCCSRGSSSVSSSLLAVGSPAGQVSVSFSSSVPSGSLPTSGGGLSSRISMGGSALPVRRKGFCSR